MTHGCSMLRRLRWLQQRLHPILFIARNKKRLSFKEAYKELVDDDAGLQRSVSIKPGSILFCHIYPTLCPVAGKGISIRIPMGKLRSGAIGSTPGGVNN